MNEKMRRKDRETTEERAYEILKNGEYGILSTIGEDGYPYGVPALLQLRSLGSYGSS